MTIKRTTITSRIQTAYKQCRECNSISIDHYSFIYFDTESMQAWHEIFTSRNNWIPANSEPDYLLRLYPLSDQSISSNLIHMTDAVVEKLRLYGHIVI